MATYRAYEVSGQGNFKLVERTAVDPSPNCGGGVLAASATRSG